MLLKALTGTKIMLRVSSTQTYIVNNWFKRQDFLTDCEKFEPFIKILLPPRLSKPLYTYVNPLHICGMARLKP